MNTSKRRIISIIMSVIMVFACFAEIVFSAGAEGGDYEYTVTDDGTAVITKYKGNSTEIEIPSQINEVKVTQIGGADYSIFSSSNTAVKKVTISDGIKIIEKKAFYNCASLENVSLPETTETINLDAFAYCENLKEINLPSSLQTINQPFNGCNHLKSLSVNKNNKFYSSKDGVLYNKEITSIIFYPEGKENEFFSIPETVEDFADGFSFRNNKFLKKIYFPSKIEYDNLLKSDVGFNSNTDEPSNISEVTICGYSGSGAEKYADDYGLNFVDSALCAHDGSSLINYNNNESKINVLDFGAVGDGTTDDSASIQSALDYAEETKTKIIYFPNRTYLINACLYYYSDMILEFEQGAVLKRGSMELRYLLSNDADDTIKSYDGTSNVIITGAIFDGNIDFVTNENNDNKCTLLNTVHAKNIIVNDCTFINGNVWHLYEVCSSNNVKIVNCLFDGTNYGGTVKQQDAWTELLQLDSDLVTTRKDGTKNYSCGSTRNGTSGDKTGCTGIDIINCTFITNGNCNAIGNHNPTGEKHNNIKIEECTFKGGSNSGGYLDFEATTENVEICSNTFYNNKDKFSVHFDAENASSTFYNNRCFDYETLTDGFGILTYNNTINGKLVCPDGMCFDDDFASDIYCNNCCKLIESGTKINQQHEYADGKCTVCGEIDQSYKPAETTTAKPAETTTVKPAETTTVKPAETTTAKPAETTTMKPAETTTVKPAETTTMKPAETTTVKPAETTTAKPAETTTAKPAETTTAKPAETTTAKPAETTTAKPAETTTAKPAETTTKAEEKLEFTDNTDIEGKIDEENKKVSILPRASSGITLDNFKTIFKGSVSVADKNTEKVFNGMKFIFNGNEYTFIIKGDVNADGKISAADAREILRIAARLDTPDEVTGDAADIDSDGNITSKEARNVLRFAARLQNKIYE